MQQLTRAGVVAVSCLMWGCASTRAVPRPFPGAPTVATSPEEGAPAGRAPAEAAPAAEAPSAAVPDPAAAAAAPTLVLPVVATALTLQGIPYRNGGSDPSGFDCSGFVRYVFARHGHALPREVQDQFRVGARIDRDEVRPGDLVFFETVSRGASHVGIALGGNEFVHAPSSRGVVRVERFTTDYWARRWVGARRVG